MLPAAAPLVRPLFALAAIDFPAPASASTSIPARTPSPDSITPGPLRLLEVASDTQAVAAWIAARAGLAATAKAYQHEAIWLLLWL